MGKGWVVIAGSVNKTLEPWKINGPTVGTGWDPRAERAGVGGPLAVGVRGVTQISTQFISMDNRLNPEIAMEYGNVKTAVFWDYASLQIPPYVDVKSIVHNLMLKLRQKKCYGRLYGTCIQAEHKEAFQRTGIELIDVQVNSSTFSYSCEIDQPHSDAQTSTEKMYNPPPAIVVVISRNRDFVVSVTELCQQMQH
ncbi:unnamed protein product [Brassica oleracea]